MTDDIVTRLRRFTANNADWPTITEAADEIERLRRNTGCARNQHSTQFCAEALDAQREIERLREERDEARRRVCDDSLRMGSVFRRVDGRTVECSTPQDVAQMMGWDCFKEAGHGR